MQVMQRRGPRPPAAAAARAQQLRSAARNLPASLAILAKHLDRGPDAVVFGFARVLPKGLARTLQPRLESTRPALAAVLAAATGRRAEAASLLHRAAARGQRDDAVRVALEMHDAPLARALAGADEGSLAPATRVRLLAEEGHLRRASALAREHTPRLAELLDGELGVVDPTAVQGRIGQGPRDLRVDAPVQRVLHLVTTAAPEAQTGYTLRTQGIARAQHALGLDVTVTPRLGFPVDQGAVSAAPSLELDGVHLRRLLDGPLPRRADARLDRTVDAVAALVEDLRPQILHAHSKHDNAQVALAVGRRLGIPVVYEVRGFLEETWRSRGGDPGADKYLLAKDAESRCMAEADVVVTLADSMRRDIVARGIPAERVHVVPNAVAAPFLEPPPPAGPAREALGIDPGAPVVGMAGTLNAYEGIDVLLHAAAQAEIRNLVVLVVGDGPARRDWKALAAELGVDARFPGRVPHADVHAHLAAMDLFCVPRRATPVTALVPPLKPLEALATGVPVLLSALPPVTELIEESGAGWIAEPDDPASWAATMTRVLEDTPTLRRVGARGREWVLAERTWAHMARRYEVAYEAAFRHRGAESTAYTEPRGGMRG